MKTKRIAETQLDRIENALRVLLERVVFPVRNAFGWDEGRRIEGGDGARAETHRREGRENFQHRRHL